MGERVISTEGRTADASAVERLMTLAFDGASGELVCTLGSSASDGEVHVFLQRGRVAWATCTSAPRSLLASLAELGIDRDTLAEVMAECQRTKQPLGSTLIEWGLSSVDDVRTALGAHMTRSIEPLLDRPRARWVFLERTAAYEGYDARLTFLLDELVPSIRGRGYTPLVVQRRDDLRVMKALPGARVKQLAHRDVCEGARLAYEMGADFAAVRTSGAILVALETKADQGLFIEAPQGTTLVAILQALTETVRSPLVPIRQLRMGLTERPLPPGDPGAQPLLDRFDELEAVVVVSDTGNTHAASRGAMSPMQLREIVRDGATIHASAAWNLDPNESASLVIGREGLWLFATRVEAQKCDLWLVLRRSRPQALGWSILGALSRGKLPK